jgi:DNA-directed RNA polymerase subunit RPC12/RpoP
MVHTALPGDKYKCSKCASSHVDIYDDKGKQKQSCLDCGHEETI